MALVVIYVVGGTVVILATSGERGLLGTLLVGVMTVGAIVMLLLPSALSRPASGGEPVADAGVGADVARAPPPARSCAAGWRCGCAASGCRPRTGGPHTSVSSARWVSSRPRLRASTRSRSYSFGVRWTSAPSRRTTRAARSSSSPSAVEQRIVVAGARAAQDGVQARDQLARAERLGDVVVGPRLERARPSGPRRRARRGRGSASRSSRAAPGRPRRRCRRGASGRRSRRPAGAPRRRRAPRGAVAVASTSKPASRRMTFSARRICSSSSQTSTRRRPAAHAGRRRPGRRPPAPARASPAGTRARTAVPWPGSDSAHTRPPLASTKPRTIARPRPAPAPPALVAAVERLEDPLEPLGRDPGPAVDDPHEQATAAHAAAHLHRRGPARGGARSRAG